MALRLWSSSSSLHSSSLPSLVHHTLADLLEETCFGHEAKVRSVDAEEEWRKPRSSKDVWLSSTSSYPAAVGQTRKLNPKPLMRLRWELVSMLMS